MLAKLGILNRSTSTSDVWILLFHMVPTLVRTPRYLITQHVVCNTIQMIRNFQFHTLLGKEEIFEHQTCPDPTGFKDTQELL